MHCLGDISSSTDAVSASTVAYINFCFSSCLFWILHDNFRCLLPLIIDGLIKRIRGSDIIINGYYDWCPQHSVGESAAFIVGTRDEQQLKNLEITEDRFGMVFTIMTTIFVFIDFTWILCVWSAASIGTPTQPMGRDEYLR